MTKYTFIFACILSVGCGSKMSNSGSGSSEDTNQPTDHTGDPPPPEETGEPPPVIVDISEDHPRLFFSPPDFPRLQGQIYDYERVEVVGAWDAYVGARRDPTTLPLGEGAAPPSTDNEWAALTGPLPNLALYATFTDDEEVYSQVIEWMRRVAAIESWGSGETPQISRGTTAALQDFITAFDLLHDKLEPADRTTFRSKIISTTSQLYSALTTPTTPTWVKQWSGRDGQAAHAALLMAGLALEHNHDRAPQWIEHAERFVNESLSGLAQIGDGSWPEGPSLGSDALSSLTQSLFLLNRHYGLDVSDNSWLIARSEAMLRRTAPGQQAVLSSGGGSGAWLTGPIHQACFVDQFSSLNHATWMTDQHILTEDGSVRGPTLWLEFLWCDTATEPTAPSPATAKAHHFTQGGTMTWHSGFNAGDNSLLMRSGKPVGEDIWTAIAAGTSDARGLDLRNLHPDAGSFGWYPAGQPVLVTGRDQVPKRSQLENTYTFGPEYSVLRDWTATDREDWWPSGSFHADVGEPSQIGQLGEWGLDFGPANTLNDASAAFEFQDTKRGATLIGASFAGMYPADYNSDAGWQPLGLQRLTRYWLMLEEGMVLMFDHIKHTTSLTHYARFNSASSGFSISGTAGTTYASDGSSWVVDAISGGSVYTDQLIENVQEPSSTWVNQMVVSNSPGPGSHHHLTVLRSTSQALVLMGWSPTEQGVVVDLAITSDGVSATYTVRFASSANAAERQSFLGFPGTMGVTRNAESEIRF